MRKKSPFTRNKGTRADSRTHTRAVEGIYLRFKALSLQNSINVYLTIENRLKRKFQLKSFSNICTGQKFVVPLQRKQ